MEGKWRCKRVNTRNAIEPGWLALRFPVNHFVIANTRITLEIMTNGKTIKISLKKKFKKSRIRLMFRLMWFYVILNFCVKNLRHKKLKLCHIELTSNNMVDFQGQLFANQSNCLQHSCTLIKDLTRHWFLSFIFF